MKMAVWARTCSLLFATQPGWYLMVSRDRKGIQSSFESAFARVLWDQLTVGERF